MSLALGALLSAACGNGDDYDPGAATFDPGVTQTPAAPAQQPAAVPPAIEDVTPAVPDNDPSNDPGVAGSGSGNEPGTGSEEGPPVTAPPGQTEQPQTTASPCATPNGVNGRPTTLQDAVILMNTLPRPTTLPCFLEALTRPLKVYLTESDQSLQPSPGPESPRIFIVNEPLVMSIVPVGSAAITLELGYRTQPRRSIKTEILFPLTTDVTFDTFFDEVLNGTVTRCSACHTSETKIFDPDLNIDVFESDIYEPFSVYEVTVDTLRTARQGCDATAEPGRCEILGALFDHGDVVAAPQGIMFTP